MEKVLSPAEKRQKFLWELKDLLIGAALPFVIMCIFSSTIIMFGDSDDIAIAVLAIGGGNLLLIAAFVIFGRQNGAVSYRKFYLNETKRRLNSSDKNAIYKTGEYALWKGIVIPLITCVPFIILQIVNIAVPNTFCIFALKYVCGWAYLPLAKAGVHEAVNFIFIVVPVASHLAGYVLGMLKEQKLQAQLAEESAKVKKHKKSK